MRKTFLRDDSNEKSFLPYIKRIILIVLDGFGVGAHPDAEKYHDEGADTLNHIVEKVPAFSLPHLAELGLYSFITKKDVSEKVNVIGSYAKLQELSNGKDTTTGHWEMGGIILNEPFPTYPNGFPPQVISEFERRIGVRTLGNIVCSGTEILKLLGEEHLKTGFPIVYTSADSVFQIAAHEEVVPVEKLYHYCEVAREMLGKPPFEKHNVGRVIARPFIGKDRESFKRTSNRKDFSIKPIQKTVLDYIKEDGGEVVGIGKIEDIFAGQGITVAIHTKDNAEGIEKIIYSLNNFKKEKTFIFVNLVDFDMLWGHRRDVVGYYNGLKYFDDKLPQILGNIHNTDLLIITSDHGNDPLFVAHTDHTREYVPLMTFSNNKSFLRSKDLGVIEGFNCIAKTIDELFMLKKINNGVSLVERIFSLER